MRRKCFVRSNPSRQREGDKVRRPAARIRQGCVLHGKKKYREQTPTSAYTRKRTIQVRVRRVRAGGAAASLLAVPATSRQGLCVKKATGGERSPRFTPHSAPSFQPATAICPTCPS